jgi:hypothetical protein
MRFYKAKIILLSSFLVVGLLKVPAAHAADSTMTIFLSNDAGTFYVNEAIPVEIRWGTMPTDHGYLPEAIPVLEKSTLCTMDIGNGRPWTYKKDTLTRGYTSFRTFHTAPGQYLFSFTCPAPFNYMNSSARVVVVTEPPTVVTPTPTPTVVRPTPTPTPTVVTPTPTPTVVRPIPTPTVVTPTPTPTVVRPIPTPALSSTIDEFSLVFSDYQKLLSKIGALKKSYVNNKDLLNLEKKLLGLPIVSGEDLSTVVYNIESVNKKIDSSITVWNKIYITNIKCIKGNKVKNVTAKNPKCPSGYKKA